MAQLPSKIYDPKTGITKLFDSMTKEERIEFEEKWLSGIFGKATYLNDPPKAANE